MEKLIFRGICTDNGDIVEGSLVQSEDGNCHIHASIECGYLLRDVIPATVELVSDNLYTKEQLIQAQMKLLILYREDPAKFSVPITGEGIDDKDLTTATHSIEMILKMLD